MGGAAIEKSWGRGSISKPAQKVIKLYEKKVILLTYFFHWHWHWHWLFAP